MWSRLYSAKCVPYKCNDKLTLNTIDVTDYTLRFFSLNYDKKFVLYNQIIKLYTIIISLFKKEKNSNCFTSLSQHSTVLVLHSVMWAASRHCLHIGPALTKSTERKKASLHMLQEHHPLNISNHRYIHSVTNVKKHNWLTEQGQGHKNCCKIAMAISSMVKSVPFSSLHTKVPDGFFPSTHSQKISYRVSDVKANFMGFYTRNASYYI